MELAEIAARVQELSDLHELTNLKAHYCWLLDTRRTAEAAALFSEDGVWDGGETFGRHEGREAVAATFAEIQARGLRFCLHGVLTPFLERRTPATAFGRWYLDMPATFAGEDGSDRAVWGAAWYEDDFVKGDDGVWRVQRMRLTNHFWTPFERGWAEQRFVGD
jgi:hypothetical protein